jgi:ribonuclease-3 family protein
MDYFHLSAGQDVTDQISSLGLAHLGDGVYELMVRAWLCLHGKATNKGLHRAAVTYVSAPAQAQRAEKILSMLTTEEQEVFRRGRNTHTATVPKGASVGQYHTATALEALFGWLYLRGETGRLNELFERMMEE